MGTRVSSTVDVERRSGVAETARASHEVLEMGRLKFYAYVLRYPCVGPPVGCTDSEMTGFFSAPRNLLRIRFPVQLPCAGL